MTNLVSEQFAIQHRLKAVPLHIPSLSAANQGSISTTKAYEVPLLLVDSRGTVRQHLIICAGSTQRGNTPILLGIPALEQLKTTISFQFRKWYFNLDLHHILAATSDEIDQTIQDEGTEVVYMVTLGEGEYANIQAVLLEEESIPLPGEDDGETPADRQGIPTELQEYQDVFEAESAGTIPRAKETDHSIDIKEGETVPFGPIYPLSRAELAILREYLEENLKNGRIRHSKSPAGAPILFVPKKDGTLRLCVDYRGLNKITEKNRYPLPLITEILDRISGCTFFSKIDVKDAYYRIRIKEGDEWKTAFRTRYGHFEYMVMPFGLTNAPATFQHYIHKALGPLVDVVCVAYLDDILVFSKDHESHTEHLQQVLERMRDAELYAKPSKCEFYQSQVEFLGFILSGDGIAMDPRRVDTIASWEEPKTYREIQVFVGFCNFYRRFIYNYSGIVTPLTSLLKGSKDGKKPGAVQLQGDAKEAFEKLKRAFQEAPLLVHFDPEKRIRIETDASAFAMAGVISQLCEDGLWHPIAFWSRKFNSAELNYGTPDQEMLAIVESFKHWRHYVEGPAHSIEVLTDHQNLQAFTRKEKVNGRQVRWLMYLAPHDFVIKYRTGKTNPADAPSRRPDYEQEPVEDTELLAGLQARIAVVQSVRTRPMHWGDDEKPSKAGHGSTISEWKTLLEQGRNFPYNRRVSRQRANRSARVEMVYDGTPSKPLLELIQEAQAGDSVTQTWIRKIRDETLSKNQRWNVGDDGLLRYRRQLYVPAQETIRQEILRIHHDDPLAGHFGTTRTLELIQRKYYWENIAQETRKYVKECPVCQYVTSRRHKPYGTLQSLPRPTQPFQECSMDFITGLPKVEHHGRIVDAILVIVDRYTKYATFLPVSTTINAPELAELFYREIECRFGRPEGVVSDRGSVFTSEFWSTLCYHANIKRKMSTAFHPQTDGQTERANQTLEHYLRAFISSDQTNWATLLPSAQFACNNAQNSTIMDSPNHALYKFHPATTNRVEADSLEEGVPEAHARLQKLAELRKRLEEHWDNALARQAKYYNKKHKPLTLKIGDLVLLSTKHLQLKNTTRKLNPKFIGPFRIDKRIGTQAYRLILPTKYLKLHNVFHISLLEPWNGDLTNSDPLTMPDLADENEHWEIDEIRDIRRKKGSTQYLIKWKGWPSEYNQWVNHGNINAPELIKDFESKRRHRVAGDSLATRQNPNPAKLRNPGRKWDDHVTPATREGDANPAVTRQTRKAGRPRAQHQEAQSHDSEPTRRRRGRPRKIA